MFLLLFIFIIILIYAILKEREELGCYRISIKQQCNDNNSVFLINTKTEDTDNIELLYKRIVSILSYHEKSGVWRRCYILSSLLLLILYIVNNSTDKSNIFYWFNLLLLYFTILYFFFNYLNYHHFRNLKNNGIEILEKIKNINK